MANTDDTSTEPAVHLRSEHLRFWLLRLENERRCEESFYPVASRSPNDWAAAIAEECGEVARIAKRIRDGKITEEEAYVEMAHELADVVMYVDLLAARLGIDLAGAVAEKFNLVSERVGSARRLPVGQRIETRR